MLAAGGFVTKEEAHCNELAELALNDIGYASQVLQELLVDASLPSPISKDHPACLSFQASLGNGLKVREPNLAPAVYLYY